MLSNAACIPCGKNGEKMRAVARIARVLAVTDNRFCWETATWGTDTASPDKWCIGASLVIGDRGKKADVGHLATAPTNHMYRVKTTRRSSTQWVKTQQKTKFLEPHNRGALAINHREKCEHCCWCSRLSNARKIPQKGGGCGVETPPRDYLTCYLFRVFLKIHECAEIRFALWLILILFWMKVRKNVVVFIFAKAGSHHGINQSFLQKKVWL